MTKYEALDWKKGLCIEAAANCDYHSSTAMSEMWIGKAETIRKNMMAMTIEEANKWVK